MFDRYNFYRIFAINPTTQDIYPLFTTIINGVTYPKLYSISRGPSFGGIDIYGLIGRDFSGIWNPTAETLTITGIL